MRPKSRGFTLTDLMVVFAIFTLLAAITLPSITRVHEQARTLQCATNMGQIGQLVALFANQHDGRGPGIALTLHGDTVGWSYILNNDLLQRTDNALYVYAATQTPEVKSIPEARLLTCPSFVPIANTYRRPYSYNLDAMGGQWRFQAPQWSQYGNPVIPATTAGSGYAAYNYGAMLSKFSPDQFLLVERDYGDDVISGGYDVDGTPPKYNPNGHVTLGGQSAVGTHPEYPVYDTVGGFYSFRHPYSQGANFLYIDGHVGLLTPDDDVNSSGRYKMPATGANGQKKP